MDHDLDKRLARSIGRAAREARKALGLTQAEVAERIGRVGEFYARLERGNALPSVQTLNSISLVLDVSVDLLLGLEGPRATTHPAARPPDDPPEIRRVARLLRKARPDAVQVVNRVLKAMERKP